MPGFLFYLVPLCISVVVIAIAVIRRERPEGIITPWNVHYTKDCIYTDIQLSKALSVFIDSWCHVYPEDKRALLSSLAKLDIYWTKERIDVPPFGRVIAVMDSPQEIRVWIGPKLPGNKRNIAYTGLFDQLANLAQIANNREVQDTAEIQDLVNSAKSKLLRP